MIDLDDVSDSPRLGLHRRELFDRVSLTLPTGRYALLAADPDLRRHAIDILSRARLPHRGRVFLNGTGSWALGRSGFVRGKANGLHTVDLVARLYGLHAPISRGFVGEIVGDPQQLHESIEHWSGTARQEFGYAVGLLPAFDIYFVDGVLPSGKGRFAKLWRPLFEDRIRNRTLVLSSTRVAEVRRYCTMALVIDRGRMEIVDDLEAALDYYPPRLSGEEDRGPAVPDGDDGGDLGGSDATDV